MVSRIPNSRWIRVERGGHIFIHKDAEALRRIAIFLADATSAPADVDRLRELALAQSAD
jgi:hypothetical protein